MKHLLALLITTTLFVSAFAQGPQIEEETIINTEAELLIEDMIIDEPLPIRCGLSHFRIEETPISETEVFIEEEIEVFEVNSEEEDVLNKRNYRPGDLRNYISEEDFEPTLIVREQIEQEVIEEVEEIVEIDEIDWEYEDWTYDDYEIEEPAYEFDEIPASALFANTGSIANLKGKIAPGTISKDGLIYIISMDVAGDERLYVMTRESLDQPFGEPVKLLGAFGDLALRDHQPSLSADNKVMVFVRSEADSWSDNQLYTTEQNEDGVWMNIRPMDALNKSGYTDAYPWLSPDGLVLYWTSNRDGDDWIYFSERKSLKDEFKKVNKLDINFNDEILSCWLSDDMTRIYFSDRNTIHTASRSNPNAKFGEPEVYMTPDLGFIGAATFTSDMSQMMVYNSTSDTRIVHYWNEILVTDEPTETEVAEVTMVDPTETHVIEPAELKLPPVDIIDPIEVITNDPIEVAVPEDDPEIIEAPELGETFTELEVDEMITNGYPNPTNASFTVELQLPESFEEGVLVFFSLDGKELKTAEVTKGTTKVTFDHSDLPAGTYLYQLRNNNISSTPLQMVIAR